MYRKSALIVFIVSIIVLSIFALWIYLLKPATDVAYSAPRKIWAHSCYVFRDMNRNGIFDMGDKPYGNLELQLDRPDGTTTTRRSNIDGFANFNASSGNKAEHVYQEGIHRVKALFPSGWQAASRDSEQDYEFVKRPNAGGGLVPVKTCRPIGVAPILWVKGSFSTSDGTTLNDYRLEAVGNENRTLPLEVDQKGNFSFVGEPGEWKLRIIDKSNNSVKTREFSIDKAAVRLSHIQLGKAEVTSAARTVSNLNFDDLLISDSLFEIPFGYGGLNWLNWISVHNRFYQGTGYVNMTMSSEYVAYNSSGVPALMWSDRAFDFVGTYIGVAWPRGEEDDVIIKAWRGDVLAYEDRLRLSDNGPLYFDADYRRIDKLEFSSGNYERIVLDNFQYRY